MPKYRLALSVKDAKSSEVVSMHVFARQVLPPPTELDLPIPAEMFGDVIELLEFFCVFGKHFGLSYQAAQPVTCGECGGEG